MEQITLNKAKQILLELHKVMLENKDMLIEVDSIMGDGDLGLTMDKIFTAAHETMKDTTDITLGKFFTQAGMSMAKAAPSTMGTLVAGAFMTAGKNAGDTTSWNKENLVDFYSSLAQGIMTRGKAKLGEKTIVDVLYPVSEYLKQNPCANITETATKAYDLSKDALEKTKDMVAQHGRAAYYQDKSKGHQDAGATVGVLIFQGVKNALK